MLTQRRIYEFDDFRVDTGQFLLTRAGRTTPITPTVFRILLILLERAGEVVTKEQLIKFVWPDIFVDDLVQDGQAFHLARGRCSESLTESEPFMPWIEALGTLAKEPTVREVMQKAAPTWHREISHTGSGAPRRMKRELLDFCRQI